MNDLRISLITFFLTCLVFTFILFGFIATSCPLDAQLCNKLYYVLQNSAFRGKVRLARRWPKIDWLFLLLKG